MNYETKIYLDKLFEAVDKLNSPDWWTIGITVVNAFIMIWLGWNQYKLQKRQTKALEDELYRRLSLIIREIHFEAKFVMFDVNHYLINRITMQPDDNIWRKKVKLCIDLSKQLGDCSVDIDLKFSKGLIDIDAYMWVLMSMSQFSSMFESLLLENKVDHTNQCSIQIQKPYIDSVNRIAQRIDKEMRGEFFNRLLNFLNALDGINEDETMSKIKKHSKIDA